MILCHCGCGNELSMHKGPKRSKDPMNACHGCCQDIQPGSRLDEKRKTKDSK